MTTKKPKPKPVTLAKVTYTDAQGRKRERYTARCTLYHDQGIRRFSYALYDQEKQKFPLRRCRGGRGQPWTTSWYSSHGHCPDTKNIFTGPHGSLLSHPTDYWKAGTKRGVEAYIERTTKRGYELERVEDALDRNAA